MLECVFHAVTEYAIGGRTWTQEYRSELLDDEATSGIDLGYTPQHMNEPVLRARPFESVGTALSR